MGGTVAEAWAEAVVAHADRVALKVDGATLTYAELDAASAEVAATLAAADPAADADAAAPGAAAAAAAAAAADDDDDEAVPIEAATDPETIVRLLGALRAGRVAL